jgi:hypothetical protein
MYNNMSWDQNTGRSHTIKIDIIDIIYLGYDTMW